MKSRSPRSFAWVAFASVLIMLSLPGGAVAQAAEDERAEGTDAAYDDAIAEAVDAYERADYEATLRAFTRAHVLFPNARTHRGLGIVHYALGDYPRAVDELNAALASSVAPLDDALREQTQRLRDAAAQRAEAGPPGGVPETGGVPDDQRDDASSDEPERPPMEASLAPEAVAPAMVETSGSSPSLELIEPRPRVRRTRVAWALAGTAYGAAALEHRSV